MLLLECYQGWLSLHLDELRTQLENLLLEVQRLEGEQWATSHLPALFAISRLIWC